MNNSFQIDGKIDFVDKTNDVGKNGKEFLVRGFGLDKTEYPGGEERICKIKFQLKGQNCKKADEVLFNGDKYFLRPGDLVILDFGLVGLLKDDKEKSQKAKENPAAYPGNPTGMEYGITNINCWSIVFATGYTPNPANKVGVQAQTSQVYPTQQQNNTNTANLTTPSDPKYSKPNPATGKPWTQEDVDNDLPF